MGTREYRNVISESGEPASSSELHARNSSQRNGANDAQYGSNINRKSHEEGEEKGSTG